MQQQQQQRLWHDAHGAMHRSAMARSEGTAVAYQNMCVAGMCVYVCTSDRAPCISPDTPCGSFTFIWHWHSGGFCSFIPLFGSLQRHDTTRRRQRHQRQRERPNTIRPTRVLVPYHTPTQDDTHTFAWCRRQDEATNEKHCLSSFFEFVGGVACTVQVGTSKNKLDNSLVPLAEKKSPWSFLCHCVARSQRYFSFVCRPVGDNQNGIKNIYCCDETETLRGTVPSFYSFLTNFELN